MNKIVDLPLFMQFGVSGMMLCSSLYQISCIMVDWRFLIYLYMCCGITHISSQLIYVFFFILQIDPAQNLLKLATVMVYIASTICQILVNCYLGSRISDESDGITHAIYSSQWIDRSEKCKRACGILAERSMRPITIFAGGVFELSLTTFVKVFFFLLNRLIR